MVEVMTAPASTARFARKREAIIAAATEILNHRGAKGMTLADVASSVGLITTSVTYYFKKKEDLAAACYLASIARLEGLVAEALTEATPEARLHRLLALYLDLVRAVRLGDAPPVAVFGEVRALSDDHRATVGHAYGQLFRQIRSLFDAPGFEWLSRKAATARTYALMEQISRLGVWLPHYDLEDYPRVGERMFDILRGGLAQPGADWKPCDLPSARAALAARGQEASRETFLLAATRLINQEGYRGASVEKISAVLNVTKGSFYHHIEAKDDLVVACFERSFDMVRRVQFAALERPLSPWNRLCAVARVLVEHQLSDEGPLLRTSALNALPESMRERMVEQSDRLSARFAGMIADGVAEGSVRPVDPMIAAQMLNATLNAAADLRGSPAGVRRSEVGELYAKPMLMGMFSR
jgi:AcrR family transcriptional regulator